MKDLAGCESMRGGEGKEGISSTYLGFLEKRKEGKKRGESQACC